MNRGRRRPERGRERGEGDPPSVPQISRKNREGRGRGREGDPLSDLNSRGVADSPVVARRCSSAVASLLRSTRSVFARSHLEGARQNRTSHVIEILDGLDPHMREHMIDKFFDMVDPSQSTVRAPMYNTEHRGRPIGRDEQNRRHIPSFEDASTSRARITQPTTMSRAYISHTVDVQPDGHCGFRAIAALVGYSEEGWSQVRLELIEEIQQKKDLYDQLYPDRNWVANLLFSLNWFEPWAPEMYWMDSMPLGIVIASRYNLVLHTFGENIASCFTHLPLRSPPVPNQERREIAITHVGNHFVQVFLHPHYPVPPIPTWWWQHSSYEAKEWAARYRTHVHLWYEVIGAPSRPEAEFGGNID
ncbi:hypothetical protein Acr_00g0047190 [Actinidia rufa]|uniref:OTU domain-containing protein n=1 Tax=Actinidia rufa TaxID=165716 RepID=A0A7J0DJN6_9ERIC|nr:hypothetical protein Acr_00g0047190 [Actinidia rufa]